MAKFHQGLKYHEDNVGKHPITQEEINFLTELQDEMNTQDTCCEADPRYWAIRDIEMEPCTPDDPCPDRYAVYVDGKLIGHSDRDVYRWLMESNFTETMGHEFKDMHLHIQFDKEKETFSITDLDTNTEWNNGIKGLKEFIEQDYETQGAVVENWDIDFIGYNMVRRICPSSVYLTHRRAIQELETRYYHYHEDAHTYAMTSPDPDMKTLYRIIQSVDWNSILQPENGTGQDGAAPELKEKHSM